MTPGERLIVGYLCLVLTIAALILGTLAARQDRRAAQKGRLGVYSTPDDTWDADTPHRPHTAPSGPACRCYACHLDTDPSRLHQLYAIPAKLPDHERPTS